MVSSQNILTFALAGNGPMTAAASALAEIRYKGLKGLQASGDELELEASSQGSGDHVLFCVGDTRASAVLNSSNEELILTLCDGSTMSADTVYSFSITVTNPSSPQPAPTLSISARGAGGKVLFDWFPLAKPSAEAAASTTPGDEFIASGFADPLFTLSAGFSIRSMGQSNSLALEQNTLTLTLQTYVDLFSGSSQLSSFTTSKSSPTFIITGLSGAVISSSDVALTTPTSLALESSTKDGSELFCSPDGKSKRATWDDASNSMKLSLCNLPTLMRRGYTFALSFDIVNPASGQSSPAISIALEGGTSWAPAAITKPSTTSLQPLSICSKPACSQNDGFNANSCTTCNSCPPKQCPSGQQLRVAGCSATSGGECIDCAFFNATWGGAACVCSANFFGDGLSCSPCPSGRISNEGSSLITDCVQPSSGYIASMTVRIAGTAASFDVARQQQFLAAMQQASPSALNISITSITEVSIGRRRLLAAYLDIGLDMLYADQASAESAAASDLTESNLNNQMVDAGLGTLTFTAQPTVRQAAAAEAGSDTLPQAQVESTPTWLIIVASAGGVLAVGAGVALIIILRRRWRSPVAAGKSTLDGEDPPAAVLEKPVLDEGDLEKLKNTVVNGEPVDESKFTEEAKDLITGKAKEAAFGLKPLLCVESQSFYRRIGLGVAGIEEEVKQFVEEGGGSDAPENVREVLELFNYIVYEGSSEKKYPNGIRDKGRKPGTRLEHFVSDPKAIEAGLQPAYVVALRMYTTSIYRFMNDPLRDQKRKRKNVTCPLPVTTWFTAEGIKQLRSLHAPKDDDVRRVPSDATEPDAQPAEAPAHAGDVMRIESIGSSPDLDFERHGADAAIAPSNSTGSSAAPAVPIHDARRAQGHLPTEMIANEDGMRRDAFGESRVRFDVVGASFGESSAADIPSDDLERQNTTKIDPNEGFTLWRGMRNTKVTDVFTQSGGTELAFMSTTSDISVAVKYSMSSNSLLFRIIAEDFMSMGADLKWLSAFPGEKEFLYPPLTYLKPTGRVKEGIAVHKGEQEFKFTVVEVKPIMGT